MHNCNYCDHTTTFKSNLRRHIKNKHENHATPKISFIKKYNCSRCNYGSDRKWTVKDHERRVHNGDNSGNINESPNHISMKNETLKNNQNYLRKIKMMLKENVLLDLYISTLRRNVDILSQRNNNEFNTLAQHYEKILNYSQDINQNSGGLFESEEDDDEEDEVENEQTLYERYI